MSVSANHKDPATKQGTARAKLKQLIGSRQIAHSVLYPAGACVALMGASQVDAGVITSNAGFTVGDNASVGWDIDGDSVTDMTFSDTTLCTSSEIYRLSTTGPAGSGIAFSGNNGVNGRPNILPVTASTTIDSSKTFGHLTCGLHDRSCDSGAHSGQFEEFPGISPGYNVSIPDGYTGVFGFSFDNNGTTNYGVARFRLDDMHDGLSPVGTFSIVNWAYEDSGAAISGSSLGAVPEPSTFAIFLGCLAAGGASRRRRKQTPAT